jgi:hypothetical protein
MTAATISTFVVPQPGQLEIPETLESALANGRFPAENLFSRLSAGTELTWHLGTDPYLSAGWDAELGLVAPDRPAQHLVPGSLPVAGPP